MKGEHLRRFKLLDVHCHIHEVREAEKYGDILIVAVSDDLESSRRTLEMARKMRNVIPCVGLHPWAIEGGIENFAKELEKLVIEGAPCIGEVGLDKKFVAYTYEVQLPIFKEQVKLAKEHGLSLNLHAAGAWREVFEIVLREDIDKALFHWYTGPLDLLKEIESVGYFISVNPAVVVQEKHRKVVEEASMSVILTESDSPYEYRGLNLSPDKVEESVKEIASIKGLDEEEVVTKLFNNLRRYLSWT